MCNIVTEFYLYSIVYIYLINSRLDVTFSVRHHFRTLQTLSWCQSSGKIQGGIYSDRTHTAFQEAFREDFEHSDFFRDHPLQPQHIGDVRREFIHLWTRIGT